MPPKKKRKPAKDRSSSKSQAAAAASPSAAAATPSPRSSSSFVQGLASHVQELSRDKTRCVAALQALLESSSLEWMQEAPTQTLSQGQRDAQCLWLTTHTINRLLQCLVEKKKKQQQHKQDTCHVLARLCFDLTTCLFSEKSKMEKCGQGTHSKPIVGRALMSIALACMQVLSELSSHTTLKPPSPQSELPLQTSMVQSLLALDAVVHHAVAWNSHGRSSLGSHHKSSSHEGGWHHARGRLHQVAEWREDDEAAWNRTCTAANTALQVTPAETACLQSLWLVTPTTAGRPKSSPRTTKSSSGKQSHDSPFMKLGETHSLEGCGRVSMRRWASMVLGWVGQGPQVLLQVVLDMLQHATYWNAVLDCSHEMILPETTTTSLTKDEGDEEETTTTTSRKSKRKRDKKSSPKKVAASSDATPTTPAVPAKIPGPVMTVLLCARLAEIVTESSHQCGTRPPAGDLLAYASDVLCQSANHNKRPRGLPDILQSSLVVVHRLVCAHKKCFDDIGSNVVVNDETSDGAAVKEGVAQFYPLLGKTLEGLCRAASASSTLAAAPPTQKVLGWAAALAFKEGPMEDARLMNFCLQTLSEALTRLSNDESTTSGETAGGSMETEPTLAEFGYDQTLPTPELPVPVVPSKGGRKKKSSGGGGGATCFDYSFGGVYSDSLVGVSHDEVVGLFVRAMIHKDDNEGDFPPTTQLLECLVQVIRTCYDLTPTKKSTSAQHSVQGDGGSQRKKRKLDKRGKGHVMEPIEDSQESVSSTKKIITSVRAGLASEVTHVLEMFAARPKAGSKHCRLRQFWRTSFSSRLLGGIVELNEMLDNVMINGCHNSRLIQKKDKKAITPASFFESSQSTEFRHWERSMWTAHLNLCLVLGRGHLTYNRARVSSAPGDFILNDPERRLAVFRAVVATENEKARKARGKGDGWPLSLAAPYHALVASALTSISVGNDRRDTEPERFIVDSFILTFEQTLSDLTVLVPESWYGVSTLSYGDRFDYDDIPLALHDARILVLAFSRLLKRDQQKAFSSIVSTVSSGLDKILSNESVRFLVESNWAVSAFLARLVTVCTTLAHVTVVGDNLRDLLFTTIGPTDYRIPIPLPRDEAITMSYNYGRARSYMSILTEWNSPTIPEVDLPHRLNQLDAPTTSNLNHLFETALGLGMSSAGRDTGHLLFAAWNASAQMACWTEAQEDEPRHEPTPVAIKDLPKRLIELRQDIYHVHRYLHGQIGSAPRCLVSTLLRRKSSALSGGSLPFRQKLALMISKAERMVDDLLDMAVAMQEKGTATPIVFSSLAALSSYIAFIVSMCTKPSGQYFPGGSTARRPRRSDDDSLGSNSAYDFEDECIDETMDAFAEFDDACESFGAAPIHPDWLDHECIWRGGVTKQEADVIAEKAVTCLTKMSSIAHSQRIKAYHEALRAQNNNSEALTELAARLCIGSESLGNEKDGKDDGFCGAVASLCRVDQNAVKRFCVREQNLCLETAEETWLPFSAIRIKGRIPPPSDMDLEVAFCMYRATGEWELLLTDSLLCSCLTTNMGANVVEPSANAYVCADRWKFLQEACVSNLMPSAALLRFSLSGGRGRKRHPLDRRSSSAGDTNASLSLPIHFTENVEITLREEREAQVKTIVYNCIASLAQVVGMGGSEYFRRSCHAVGANLMVDSYAMVYLEAMEMFRFVFDTLKQLETYKTNQDAHSEVVVDMLTRILESEGSIDDCSSTSAADKQCPESPISRLYFFLVGSHPDCQPIVNGIVGCSKVLSNLDLHSGWSLDPGVKTWGWDRKQEEAISTMVRILLTGDWSVTQQTRLRLARLLSQLGEHEYGLTMQSTSRAGILGSIQIGINSLREDAIEKLIDELTYVSLDDPSDESMPSEMSKALCVLAVHVIGLANNSTSKTWNRVLDGFVDRLEGWAGSSCPGEHMTSLLYLLGCRYNALDKVGSCLTTMSMAQERNHKHSLKTIERFFRFIQDLNAALMLHRGNTSSQGAFRAVKSPTEEHLVSSQSLESGRESSLPEGSNPPTACSFILKSGFYSQHWYHCFTCGLVWDKGMCTLCALRCHEGHDVTYSRYSSFFCDCGGDPPSPDDPIRVACKCSTRLQPDEVRDLFKKERSATLFGEEEGVDVGIEHASVQGPDTSLYSTTLRLASSRLESYSSCSLEKLKKQASNETWVATLFEVLSQTYDRWKEAAKESIPYKLSSSGNQGTSSSSMEIEASLKSGIFDRDAVPSVLERMPDKALVPIRCARSSAFDLKLSIDSTTDRLNRALLTKNRVKRSAIVVDSRGRMIVAEPCSLLFCSILPFVNTRYDQKASQSPCPRSQMCILGKASVKFNIVGMSLCKLNERHLVVWGVTEACVVVLSQSCDKVEKTIDLHFEIEPHECEGDYLLKCEWVPGSQTMVVVACGAFVKIFDVKLADNAGRSLSSRAGYLLDFDAMVRGIALVPSNDLSPGGGVVETTTTFLSRTTVDMMLLLDSGELRNVSLKFDANGDLEARGETCLEYRDGIPFPTAGIRPYTGSRAGASSSISSTLGSGSCLVHLQKSGLLLYQCAASCVLAMQLDTGGEIKRTFELLPFIVSSEVLGHSTEGYSISGPYSHWTELGVVRHESGTCFRTVCVGKSSRTSQPKLLCVDFNESYIGVKEISWSTGTSMGLGLSLSSSFEGLSAFSAPDIPDNISSEYVDIERSFLCAVTSNGGLLVFGDNLKGGDVAEETDTASLRLGTVHRQPISDSVLSRPGATGAVVVPPRFPLTIFEHLENVSESDELVFGGDGVGSDRRDAKSRLSQKSSLCLMCPSREGCTITISLERKRKAEERGSGSKHIALPSSFDKEKVIIAIRLLVGSTTTEFIPKFVSVEGRRVELKPQVKRWYDLPLTPQEIAFSLRNGFVAIGIGASSDSLNSPLIDAVEVYATDRASVERWLPKRITFDSQGVGEREPEQILSQVGVADSLQHYENIVAATTSLNHLFGILGTSEGECTSGKDILKKLIKASALDADGDLCISAKKFLAHVEPDSRSRQAFIDEATICGVYQALRRSAALLVQMRATASDDKRKFLPEALSLLSGSLKCAATISASRPSNYIKANELVMDEERSVSSIASFASDLISAESSINMQHFIAELVELSLTEAAFANPTGPHRDKFVSLDVVFKSLCSKEYEVVENCCNSIGIFVRRNFPGSLDSPKFSASGISAPVRYQCDCCSLFPIESTRYTLTEGDTDLCVECYTLALAFAKCHDFDSKLEVEVKGNAVKLTCEEVGNMCETIIPPGPPLDKNICSETNDTNLVITADGDESKNNSQQRAYEGVVQELVTRSIQSLNECVSEESSTSSIQSAVRIVYLLLRIVRECRRDEFQVALATEFAEAMVNHIARLVEFVSRHNRSTEIDHSRVLLTVCLRSLSSLVEEFHRESINSPAGGSELVASEGGNVPKARGKTDPRFVCDVHGAPAVRRRCSSGVHKNRRFYVCGMDRDSRCKYFKWADEDEVAVTTAKSKEKQKSRLAAEIESIIWNLLKKPTPENRSIPLHVKLCELIQEDVVLLSKSRVEQGKQNEENAIKSTLGSIYGEAEAMRDFLDGVFCSREKLGGGMVCSPKQMGILPDHASFVGSVKEDSSVEAALYLLAQIANADGPAGVEHADDMTKWYSVLCEVISSKMPGTLRSQAKSALKRLCGGRRRKYLSVFDHYTFASQTRVVIYNLQRSLLGAISAAEQARQCGTRWSDTQRLDWRGLGSGGLLGVQELISEDLLTEEENRQIGIAFNEIAKVAKARTRNWREFCGLAGLPLSSHRSREDSGTGSKPQKDTSALYSAPPIVSLMWSACSLSGSNQVKALKLINVALSSQESKAALDSRGASQVDARAEDEDEAMSSDGDVDGEPKEDSTRGGTTEETAHSTCPEDMLLKGARAFSVEEIYSFVAQIVLGGCTVELRRTAVQVAIKMCRSLSPSDIERLFRALVRRALGDVASLGATCIQMLQLLQAVSRNSDNWTNLDVVSATESVIDCFTRQMESLKQVSCGSSDALLSLEFSSNGNQVTRKQYDITCCVNCQRTNPLASKNNASSRPGAQSDGQGGTAARQVRRSTRSNSSGERATPGTSQSLPTVKWLSNQVRPFAKARLEALVDSTVSSEFASFNQLKYRMAISEVHLSVSDPRGRFAKTVAVYFSPRPVSDVNQLKSDEYAPLWQRCATLSLARGGSRASCKLPEAVVAANVKIEYLEFYERPGGSHGPDGATLLYCPRCTRVVNNAHGVCGNCGEVAFQCRKCRHINYDRLDAFLCVECGYCSAGSFSVELTAGVASNAVAILDDDSNERTVKVLRAATQLYQELRAALEEKIRTAALKRSHPEEGDLDGFSPALKRAYYGKVPELGPPTEPPKPLSGTSGRDPSAGAENADSSVGANNRTRSLLRLARQLRNESSDRSADILLRHGFLGRGLSVDEIDDIDRDMIGLISASDGMFGGLDSSDPLSRIVASIERGRNREGNAGNVSAGGNVEGQSVQGRSRSNTNETNTSGNTNTSTRNNEAASNKAIVEECDKLYQLMREAERECYELKRRVDSWQRLEHDDLVETDNPEADFSFRPTRCLKCSSAVTLNLLILSMKLIHSDLPNMDAVISKRFVRALFDEPPRLNNHLKEHKRLAIRTLATESKRGSAIVLSELRARLKASNDATSAEILGKLLASDTVLDEEYISLATESLGS